MRDFDGQVQSMNQWINDSEKLVNSLRVGMDPDEVSKRIQEVKVRLKSNFQRSVESYLVFHSSFLFSCQKVSLFYVKRKGIYIIHIFKFAQVLKTGVYIYIYIYIYIKIDIYILLDYSMHAYKGIYLCLKFSSVAFNA